MRRSGDARRRLFAGALSTVTLMAGGCGIESTSPAAGSFTPHVRGVLTVVTSAVPSPGFWEGTPTAVWGGFEYELARDLAERFGLHGVRVEVEPFSRIVEGHLDGADLALALITPTSGRSQVLSFSSPYLDTAPTVLVRTGTPLSDLNAAEALRWGAVRDSTFVSMIDTLIAPSTPVRIFDHRTAMLAALLHGRIGAVLLDLPLAVETAQRSNGRLQAVAQLPLTEPIAAAMPKGSGNVQAVDSAIRAFVSDGTIDHLLAVWIGPVAANAENSLPLLQTMR